MSASVIIKERLQELGITQSDLAVKLNTTRQNLNNKFSRDNFSAKELVDIANVLNAKLILKSNDGKEYIIDYTEFQ